jgi:hypothetical protein
VILQLMATRSLVLALRQRENRLTVPGKMAMIERKLATTCVVMDEE